MVSVSSLLLEMEEFGRLSGALDKGGAPTLATGLAQVHKAAFIHALVTQKDKGALVLTQDEVTAARLCEEINLFAGETAAFHYPERELTLRPVEGVSREYEHLRLSVLDRLCAVPGSIAVASATAALQRTLPPALFAKSRRTLAPGDTLPQDELIRFLLWAGYSRCEQVEGACQFAARGGIVDLFPPGSPKPLRVEYWGDEIDTVSLFSVETQRREETLDRAEIGPARELLYDTQELAGLLQGCLESLTPKQKALCGPLLETDIARLREGLDLPSADRYLPLLYTEQDSLLSYAGDRMLLLCEGVAAEEAARAAAWQEHEDVKILLEEGAIPPLPGGFSQDFSAVWALSSKLPCAILDLFPRSYPGLALGELIHVTAGALPPWSGQLDPLCEDLRHYLGLHYCCRVLAGTRRGAAALTDDLQNRGLPAVYTEDGAAFEKARVFVSPGGLSSGMELSSIPLAVITCGRAAAQTQTASRRKRKSAGKAIRDIADLSPGDYVVHSAHGIGVFEGIIKKEVQGVVKDYIKIRYAGTDMLFVPVTQLDLVSKYIGGREDAAVRLNRLNSDQWNKTRQRVRHAVSDMARELIQLYAQRLSCKGYAFSEDSDWQREFEQKFEFEETDDQLRCAEEIKRDMERPVPMDRLLCGDVGFGKTEVALRAVFKCVLDGRQCAVMVPTTILAWQHYQTFLRRFEGYPVTVELLSRFRTSKQQKEILQKLKEGRIDVVIGTHKLVQKDVQFKDLGLCIIDEEQRFGVAHKERFKELRGNVDVLTLSATPIPRTLNMAMSGIRDMSVIEEAPQDRRPVQTYVLEYNEEVLLEAIRRELRRGGQVFYLHNRIDSIDGCAARLQSFLPDAKIHTAHGRMSEEQLSAAWRSLLDRETDILVCTTIIEAGVDVPNCNTLIIEDADRMGLSQLYQLRGRVGRGVRRAYAYFTFRRGKVLSEISEKRLAAIREFTSFGSGFRIAMRDLEIRGAGDILGSQQHGHMEAVGYDLYLKLLSEAIAEQKGEPPAAAGECLVDIRISAHIPESYIGSPTQRIDVYKKIACVYTQDDYMDIMDELIDRFGEPPAAVVGLLDVALVRNSAAARGIGEITQRAQNILFYMEKPDMAAVAALAQKLRGRVLFSAGAKPYVSVRMEKGQKPLDTIREVLESLHPPAGGPGPGNEV